MVRFRNDGALLDAPPVVIFSSTDASLTVGKPLWTSGGLLVPFSTSKADYRKEVFIGRLDGTLLHDVRPVAPDPGNAFVEIPSLAAFRGEVLLTGGEWMGGEPLPGLVRAFIRPLESPAGRHRTRPAGRGR